MSTLQYTKSECSPNGIAERINTRGPHADIRPSVPKAAGANQPRSVEVIVWMRRHTAYLIYGVPRQML